ncbi:MAG: hypothetical protein ACOYB1_16915 [Limnohabitans sp.]
MPGFNLLHYPMLDRQARARRQWRVGWTGVLVGGVLAACAVQWASRQTEQLLQTRQGLQAELNARKRQVEVRQQQALQNQSIGQQLTQLMQLQNQLQAWALLQSAVLQEAQGQGLRLQRLQVESGRFEIHGHAPTVQAMSRAAQRLSERFGLPLHLSSLEAVASDHAVSTAVSFVWQGTWPGLTHGAAAPNKAAP